MINLTMYQPIAVTSTFFQLGTSNYPAYLSLGQDGMIIEGGTSATSDIIVNQIDEVSKND